MGFYLNKIKWNQGSNRGNKKYNEMKSK